MGAGRPASCDQTHPESRRPGAECEAARPNAWVLERSRASIALRQETVGNQAETEPLIRDPEDDPNGANPWWGIATRPMIGYKALHLMISNYVPKHFPPELIRFMNTHEPNKVVFAFDHPALDWERCMIELPAFDLREGVHEKFLYGNAQRFVFSARGPGCGNVAAL